MNIKRLHSISGITLSLFIALHLCNHFYSIFGAEEHLRLMKDLRLFYRNIVVETILLLSVGIQVTSGLLLFRKKRKTAITKFEKLHIYSGLYLAIFLIIHLTAVLGGRIYLHLDTNFYFGAAGLNSFPLNLFFVPYYGLAIISVFGHIASVHNNKMKKIIFGLTPKRQAKFILVTGVCLTMVIFYGLTNHLHGITIPKEYNILIGK
ncbi:MAG: hypothetical protein ABI683_11120 [Ginsengibacter sp.]